MSNKLPIAYQEVEYIESSDPPRKPYIQTNINGNNVNLKIVCKYERFSGMEQGCIFSARNDASSGISFWDDGWVQFGEASMRVPENFPLGINIIELSKNGAYLNNTRLTYSPGNSMVDSNFIIFAPNNDQRKFFGRIYYVIIYDDNNIISHLVPCYRKIDREVGLYDIINNQFYGNRGTGNFIAGPEVFDEPVKTVKPEVNWADSMEQTFEYYEVDPVTWKDKKPLDMVKTCNINRDDDADTLGSATLDIDNTLGECYIRVYLIINQNGNRFKIVLGTFLVQTPSSSYDGKTRKVSMDAYTPLLELKENPPPLGFALLKNENIMRQAYLIVRDNCRAPVVETTSDKTLQDNFVADPNEKWLSYISDLIAQAKYRLHLDEEGKILFAPIQKVDELQPVFTFNDDNSSILYPEIAMQHDLYGIPNVVEVVCSTGVKEYTARVVNDDPNSLTSTVNRGREILYRDTNPNLTGYPTEEQIDEYAKLLLEKLSSVEYQITYTHGYCPVRVGDAVRLNYKRAGLEGIKAKVIKQSIKCENGCSVNETAVFTKKLWN